MSSAVQLAQKKEQRLVGRPLKRMEDPRFVTGLARFTDDIVLPGMLHASFVRSIHAHAKVRRVDAADALKLPGVKAVFTGADIAREVGMMPTAGEGSEYQKPTYRYPLAVDEVNFAGEPIAVVVAEDKYLAADAAEMVEVEYDTLPVVSDPVAALSKESQKVHSYLNDNVAFVYKRSKGDIDMAFREADHVIKAEFDCPRLSAVPLETRSVVASYDATSDSLTVWMSTQTPHEARDDIASVLRMPETHIRVIAPDVGGGFGQKISTYPEQVAVCLASMKLGRPVKWTETRRENFLSSSHGRGQHQYVEAAVKADGRILGLKVRVVCDGGAYNDGSVSMPESTVRMAVGVYDIQAYQAEAYTTFTNKAPTGAYRGAGRPEAAFLIERTVDIISRKLRLDPVSVRLRNFIPRGKFPFRTLGGYTYDSGDYEKNLKVALEVSGMEQLRSYQRRARQRGRLVGIGISTYVEICGFGPGYPQTAAVAVTKHGKVVITAGTNPHGQGHSTPFAQIVSDELGVDIKDITVQYGDTSWLPWTTVTAGSRSAVVGGTAVLLAARKVRDKMSRIAAKMLNTRPEKLDFAEGKVFVSNSPAKWVAFEEVAATAYDPTALPPGVEPTLYEYCAYTPPDNVFPFGTHVAMVEVERDTGFVKILKYVAVDDVGRVLNPLIVEGQVQGGVIQGVSQALLERVVYDENCQLLTSTLSDYLIPSTDTAPSVECHRTETPSPLNPLGLKGVGEAGTIAATPAVVNAVEDALSPFDVTVTKLPLAPDYIHELVHTS